MHGVSVLCTVRLVERETLFSRVKNRGKSIVEQARCGTDDQNGVAAASISHLFLTPSPFSFSFSSPSLSYSLFHCFSKWSFLVTRLPAVRLFSPLLPSITSRSSPTVTARFSPTNNVILCLLHTRWVIALCHVALYHLLSYSLLLRSSLSLLLLPLSCKFHIKA